MLDADGYEVMRGAVSPEAVRAANRLLFLAVRRFGVSAEEIVQSQGTTFFPQLRWEPEVWGALPDLAAERFGWQQGDDWAEPQLLIRFPDEDAEWPLQPHVDELPPWAPGLAYRGIVGVALSRAGPEDGAPCVWPGSHVSHDAHPAGHPGSSRPPEIISLEAGDALLMHPKLSHAGTLNRGPSVRTAIYFRLVAGAGL